ncbi:MAG: hypothetical protein Q8M06_10155, partial [Methanobacteriaceae archaeon]|nr:hypothetical protein [Methanobacteriaceae archaeon]
VNIASIPGQTATATVFVPSSSAAGQSSISLISAQEVPMQSTGAPIMPLILAALLIMAGFVIKQTKN